MRVFIDGQHGTTGLKIRDRLQMRDDVELLEISESDRKNLSVRAKLMNEADAVFLCLPDPAAKEAAASVTNPRTRIIDGSSAHRTHPAWVYGLPELSADSRALIAGAGRVSVPGCHATAVILAAAPLVQRGLIPRDYPLSCHSLTGYSGRGRAAIEQYENGAVPASGDAWQRPLPYSLKLDHKHIPEMRHYAGLASDPLFVPVICNYHSGLLVTIPLASRLLPGRPGLRELHDALSEHYRGERFVKVLPLDPDRDYPLELLDPAACNGTNRAELLVLGNDEQPLLAARLDNLGKGASGAAVQCLNIMFGLEEGTGLRAYTS